MELISSIIDVSIIKKDTVLPSIYVIRNKITGDYYLGSAWRPKKRLYRHISQINKKKHSNIILIRAVEKYGIKNFEFEIRNIYDCNTIDRNELFRIEDGFLKAENPVYNISKEARYNTMSEEGIERRRLKISKKWIIIDPEGNKQIITNLRKFCRDNNLIQAHMWAVANGISSHSRGWKCFYEETGEFEFDNKATREFLITYPSGEKRIIKNLSKFCKDNGLSYGNITNTIIGNTALHKGFRAERVIE